MAQRKGGSTLHLVNSVARQEHAPRSCFGLVKPPRAITTDIVGSCSVAFKS